MRVNLSSMPDPKTLSSVSYENMRGGLNLSDDPVRVGSTQSPDMLNMWYRDGVLKKRAGQRRMAEPTAEGREEGHVWAYDKQFNGMIVYLDGTAIRYYDPKEDPITIQTVEGTNIPEGKTHGTFFAFDERLYYKADGVYLRLSYEGGTITCENILWETGDGYEAGSVYEPIIAINRKADGTGGDLYQPENRINPRKQVWFDVDDKSNNYYLPDAGCKVVKVQVGEDSVDTSAGAWPYNLNGRLITAHLESAAEDSTENTYLEFSAPLYVDETRWSVKDWTSDTSKGWNYLDNVVYSTFDIVAGEDTVYKNGTLLRKANDDPVPTRLTARTIDTALGMCPYTGYTDYFILDNGKKMNVFILGDEPALEENDDPNQKYTGDANLVSYAPVSTEMHLKNYFLVSYDYATATWSTEDWTGKTDNGWHYGKNCVYSTKNLIGAIVYEIDVTGSGTENKTYIYAIKAGINTANHNQFWEKSVQDIALEAAAWLHDGENGSVDDWEIIWVSENDRYWVYHVTKDEGGFYVTDYNQEQNLFRAKAFTQVTIHKADPLHPTVKVISEPGDYGHYVSNIIYAGRDIVWNTYYPGVVIVPASTEPVSQYDSYAQIALYRARRDFPEANITGDYAIAVKDGYITVYIDTGMEIMSYDVKTGEFKATGFIAEGYTKPAEEEVDLDLSTAAVLSNKLRVTYVKENPDALRAIADCEYAVSFGGSDAVCVVLGGCEAQPNAIFWSGNGSAGVDPTYFPMDQYNLCGSYQDPVTGFGKQQSSLIVFQTSHISKASYSIDTIGQRKYINLSLNTINSERGCDCPWSIALCGNNLAWMHSRHGVMYLKATTSAYENMVVVISENVNGNSQRPGLKALLPKTSPHACVGMEDGQRYYAFVGEELYVWDYSIYAVADGIDLLSWSRHKGFSVAAATEADTGKLWMFDADGGISLMDEETDTDFGEKIPCHYATPLTNFGGYYKLRNIVKLVLGIRSKRGGTVLLRYGGEGQEGRQKIDLNKSETITPVILKPRGLRVHHFQVKIESNGTDGGIEISSVVLLHTAAGVTR